MTTLLLVRHGETSVNTNGVCGSRGDNPLTPLGIEQARAAGVRIRSAFEPSTVVCSRLTRARQTGQVLAADLGIPLRVGDDLHEREFGVLTGQPMARFRELSTGSAWLWRPEGGESCEDVCRRVLPRLIELGTSDAPVVIVSHAAVMFCVWMSACGELGPWMVRDTPPHGSIMTVRCDAGRLHSAAFLPAPS